MADETEKTGADTSQQQTQKAAADKTSDTTAAAKDTAQKQADAPQRPEWLGAGYDGYWNAEKGLDHTKLLGDFDALKSFKAEADVRKAGIPEKPDGYKIAPPPDFKLPDGSNVAIDDKHPLAGPAREWAHKHGVTPEAFAELIGIQAGGEIANEKAFNDAAKAEREKLGAHAVERVDAVVRALEGRIGKERTASLNSAMFTAASVEAIEALLRSTPGGYQPEREGVKTARQTGDWDKLSPLQKFASVTEMPKRAAG